MAALLIFILVLTILMKRIPKVSYVFQINNWPVAFLFSFVIAFAYYILFKEIKIGEWAILNMADAFSFLGDYSGRAVYGIPHFLNLMTNVIIIFIFHYNVKGFRIKRWFWRLILAVFITGALIMIGKHGM